MTNVQTVDQVLDHIDLDRWGYRKAELVRLVAALQEGPNPAPLGRKLLMAMGRTGRQARYDHDLLIGLVEDRVLIRWRGEGRRPDCWAVTDVERWRGIRWVTPRRDVIRAFSSPLPGAAVALWTKRAGQARRCVPKEGLNEAVADAGLSVNPWSTTPRPLDTTPRVTGESPVDMVHNTTAPEGPSPSLLKSDLTHSLTPQQSEGVRDSAAAQRPAGRLLAAVRQAVRTEVFGKPAERIMAVGIEYPELVEDLIRYARGMGGVKTATGAAGLIESQADMLHGGAPPASSPAARAAGLRQQIANLEAFAPDDEHLDQLRAELGALGQSPSAVAGQA